MYASEWPASGSVRACPRRTGVGICWIEMSGAQIQSGCDGEISSQRRIHFHITRPAALSVYQLLARLSNRSSLCLRRVRVSREKCLLSSSCLAVRL